MILVQENKFNKNDQRKFLSNQSMAKTKTKIRGNSKVLSGEDIIEIALFSNKLISSLLNFNHRIIFLTLRLLRNYICLFLLITGGVSEFLNSKTNKLNYNTI